MQTGQRAWELLLQLTPFASISQSPGEGKIARFIHSRLAEHPYFQANPRQLRLLLLPAANSPAVVAALVRGRGERTVILMNHHDVVDVEDYGKLKPLAFKPMELTRSLDPETLPPAARHDLESGDWVFGRGVMDMLYGLALQVVMTEQYAASPDTLNGNILFVSVPDEENNSLGMRHCLGLLRELQREYGLDFVTALNCEPHGYDQDGHVVQTGSDGKLLPLIYCFGRETHAGALYDGINAHLLLTEVTRILELNPGFSDSCAGTVTFPPTVLGAGDMKQGYNVSTPAAAWAFFNVFTLSATPAEIMAKLVRLAEQAARNALERLHISARAWEEIAGTKVELPPWQPRVMTFAQLWRECVDARGRELVRSIDQRAAELQGQGVDLQRLTLELVHQVQGYCPDQGPKIVIALAPPFYPPVRNRRETWKEKRVMEAVSDLQDFARELGVPLAHEEYHRGISDLSYCMLQDARAVVDTVRENCPAWDRAYHLPLEDLAQIDAPALNLGPWGRDVHQKTERIYYPFATQVLPNLLERLVEKLL
ncbi:MAG: M20/M25/M40 family metallo-hydrolase [Bacillota bacterium]|jgi:arginine utilization protein RocB